MNTNLLDEDFEMPVTHVELGVLIAVCTDLFADMARGIKSTSQYKRKLNDLIDEYNDMREMQILNHVK